MFGVLTSLVNHEVTLSKDIVLGDKRRIRKGTRGRVVEEFARDGRVTYTVLFDVYGHVFITAGDI